MAATTVPFSISENGELAIYSSPDGILKLWDTSTGLLKQEYTPSSHLSATCSCLSWGPKRQMETPQKKKRKKSIGGKQLAEFDMVAVGTTAGNILLYSIVEGDVQSILEEGHSAVVNDTCWCEDDTSLVSCSADHHLVHWDVAEAKVKHKWKADSGSLHSVCLCSKNHLLSAGRSIKLWNLHTRELLKKFTGHSTEVFRLLSIPLQTYVNDTAEGSYFISAAVNDRIVNVWNIDTKSRDKSAIASFALPDEPVMLDVRKTSSDAPLLLLSVVTKSGQIFVFEHTLNGKLKKPLQPKVSVQVATSGDKDCNPEPIPILATHVCNDATKSLLLIHGNYLKPTFEKIPYDSSKPDVCLIRADPRLTSLETQTSISKIKTPSISKDLTVLAPSTMTPAEPSQGSSKRMKRKTSVSDMNMEERLNAISIDNTKSAKEPPKADTLVRLLAQGLQSGDKKILNSVLGKSSVSDVVMKNTVKKLPVSAVLPLIKELTSHMQRHAQHGLVIVRWIKTVLTVHTSYLITFPDVVEKLGMLYQMMDSRTMMFSKLSQLQGKLDLMLSQIVSQEHPEETSVVDQKALLVYQEDSSESDDDLTMDDIIPGQSDPDVEFDIFGSGSDSDMNNQDQDEEMESD